MKKLLIFFIVLLAVVAIASIGYLMRSGPSPNAAAFVPADSVFFAELPNLVETKRRWPKTALFQILHEPEVQAFLDRPKSRIPQMPAVKTNTERVKKINARNVFLAVTAVAGNTPKMVAGFSYKGPRQDVNAMLADLKSRAQQAWPTAKSDLVKHGSVEIETFTCANVTVATAFKRDWCLLADDIELLKTTLDRMDTAGDAMNLQSSSAFKKSIARLPKNPDALIFIQPGTLVDRLIGLLKTTGQQIDMQQLEAVRKVEAVSGAVKLEGELIRDAMFVLKPGSRHESVLPRNSLAFSSTDTLVYYAARLGKPASFKLPDPTLDTTGILKMLTGLISGLKAEGLTLADLTSAFGPEFGLVLDWPASAPQPTLLLSLDTRDPAKARKFADFFTNGQVGGVTWVAKDMDGARFYCMQPLGMALATPTIALTGKLVLAGLTYDSVNSAIKRANSSGGKLDTAPDYQRATRSVSAPTLAFGFIDSRPLFERLFGILRPLLTYGALFVPNSSNYVDLRKLPSTESISKHLSPIAISKTMDDTGLLVESVGPVTYNQAVVALAATAGATVGPMLKNYLPNVAALQKKAAQATAAPPAPTPASTPGITPATP